MLILGIETSCDETAASILEIHPVKYRKAVTPKGLFDGVKITVLSNVVSSQAKLHAKYGGVVPSLAAREHVKNLPKVLNWALKSGNYNLKTVDLIAATKGPGLISSLLVGTTFAKTLAWKYNKPIIGVNHLEGHIASNWLLPIGIGFRFPRATSQRGKQVSGFRLFPALCLIVSGGHTELVLMTGIGKYKLIGQTLDDAAGEAFDKIARILGLGYPGGPAISKEAEKLQVTGYRLQEKLPRPMIKSKDFNFSFAGLKTAVLYLVRDIQKDKKIKKLDQQTRAGIAAEAQQAIVDVLIAKTIKAAEKYKVKSIMLSGGVSANKLLRTKLQTTAESRDIEFFCPEMEYTTDNAAMIAMAGYFQVRSLKLGTKNANWENVKIDANLELV